MKSLRFIFLLFGLLILTACSTPLFHKASQYDFPGKNAEQIFATGQESLVEGKYDMAVKAFEYLQVNYPFSAKSEQTDVELIYAYYMDSNPVAAKAAAERYIHMYPRSKDVDYAYYMRALGSFIENRTTPQKYLPIDLSQRELTDAHQSYDEFTDLLTHFPDSAYNQDARQRMVYLRNLFAQHEIVIANFYLERKAYVAAANRAQIVITQYQQAPQVAEALAILVKAYTQLNLPLLANDALKTLQLNFPNSPELNAATGKDIPKAKVNWWQKF